MEIDKDELAARVTAARLRKGWTKEQAARMADISSITWKRVEDGLPIRDDKMSAVLRALDIPATPSEIVGRGDDANTLGDQSTDVESAPLATVRFRRPDGIGDEEWIEMRNRLGGYWEALLDAAAKER